jgi:formate dehydrogenase subunit gamma
VPAADRHDEVIDAAISRCAGLIGAIQDDLGYVPELAIDRLARALGLSRAEVAGTVSFYHDFRRSPPGRHVLKLCRAEACQAMGGDALAAHVTSALGCDFGQTSDRSVTLEAVYCLGNCACAPAVLIDGALHGRVTTARFDELASKELT